MTNGFRIGYDWSSLRKSAKYNLPSAEKHAEIIDMYLDKELEASRIADPFEEQELVTEELTRLLVEEQPDWTSESWTGLFSTILQQV